MALRNGQALRQGWKKGVVREKISYRVLRWSEGNDRHSILFVRGETSELSKVGSSV